MGLLHTGMHAQRTFSLCHSDVRPLAHTGMEHAPQTASASSPSLAGSLTTCWRW